MPSKQTRHKKGRQRSRATKAEADLQKHLEALELAGIEEYKSWCADQGLSQTLHKNRSQRRKERDLAQRLRDQTALRTVKQQTRRLGKTIERIFAGDLQEVELGTDYLRHIHRLAACSPSACRQAFQRLLLQAERCGDLFAMVPAISTLGESRDNTFIAGLAALAQHVDDWRQTAETWRPQSRNPRRQFGALARHLLAQYEVPVFLDAVWFKGDGPEAKQQQGWFKHMGRGKNIRTADVPVTLTKRMAHCFARAPEDFSVEAALRWAQIVGQDGSQALFRAVMGTRLGQPESFAEEAFWSTVILFLVHNPMLDPDCVGPLVDYVHEQKYVPQEIALRGDAVLRQAPAQPDFTMKGRSATKLLRQVEEWHGQLAQENRFPLEHWSRSSIDEFVQVEEQKRPRERLRWSVRELRSTRELMAEGRLMHHCVASYGRNCRRGHMSVWSLRVEDARGKEQRLMTIAIDNASRTITQARGKYNIGLGGKAKNEEQRQVERSYYSLLLRGRGILNRWLEREEIGRSRYA